MRDKNPYHPPKVMSRRAVDILTVKPAITSSRDMTVSIRNDVCPVGLTTMNSTRNMMNTTRLRIWRTMDAGVGRVDRSISIYKTCSPIITISVWRSKEIRAPEMSVKEKSGTLKTLPGFGDFPTIAIML